MSEKQLKLSIVVPVYNEAAGLNSFHRALIQTIETLGESYEVIYCDDGSSDDTPKLVGQLHDQNDNVKLLRLSRNFGKESALTAGIQVARGQAIIMLDGDGQHPVESIPQFISAWHNGAQVVVGVRQHSASDKWLRRIGSKLFNRLMNRVTQQHVPPGSTDFRLIDKNVQRAFLQLQENDRLTRGLIDWLGFEKQYISFTAKPRISGQPTYSLRKLLRLMVDSFVPLTPIPLYWLGAIGAMTASVSLLYILIVIIEKYLCFNFLNWQISGGILFDALVLCLAGTILMAQGIISLYASYTLRQAKARPNFIVDSSRSLGIN